MTKFTTLVMPVDKILVQIKNDHHLKWLRPLHSSPDVWDKKYCHFHKDHNHYTKDCSNLKEQIEELIRKGKLQKILKKGKSSRSRDERKEKSENPLIDEDKSYNRPQSTIGEIKTIVRWPSTGGSFKSLKKSQQKVVNRIHWRHPLKQRRETSMDIIFSEEDARGVK